MLNYDKIIIDTSNVFYRVAAFYVKDASEATCKTLIKNNLLFNYYKSVIDKLAQSTLGEVCLLFDPLLSDGSISERQKIKEGYKSNRDKNTPIVKLRINVLEKLYTHYLLEGNKRISVYHDCEYEADDFVEKLTETGKCLMISADEDFCRYLEEDRVEMLIKGLSIKKDGIFTEKNFKKKYGFKPNITSVTFWKVMYGDDSDNIVGVFQHEKTKVITQASNEMKELLKKMGEENWDISESKRMFFYGQGPFTRLKELLLLSNTSKSYERLLDFSEANFDVIESKLPRNCDIPIDKFKVKLDMQTTPQPAKKFSLSKARMK